MLNTPAAAVQDGLRALEERGMKVACFEKHGERLREAV
jgi:hypothetical protein